MTNLDQYLIGLERELNELKTDGFKSSSSLAVIEKTITITQQIVGYTVNYTNDNCASKSAAVIEIIPNDGKAMLTSIAVGTGSQYLVHRMASLTQRLVNGHNAYEFRFMSGSASDLATIQGGGTIPTMTIELTITGTSDFTTNLTYIQDY